MCSMVAMMVGLVMVGWVCAGGGDWQLREGGGVEAVVGVVALFCLVIDACVCGVY